MKDNNAWENLKQMKKRPPKEFLAYLWEYYRKPALIVIFLLAVAASVITEISKQKQPQLNMLILNVVAAPQENDFWLDFSQSSGIQTQDVCANASMRFDDTLSEDTILTKQYVVTHTASGELDAVIGNQAVFDEYADTLFADLRTVLPSELMQKLHDRLVYQNSVPIGISLSDCEKFKTAYYYEDCIFGICRNCFHSVNAVLFLQYLFS